jgi:hypothetical protein
MSNLTFTAGSAGTVGYASAKASYGTVAGTWTIQTAGVDNRGTSCTNNPPFSIDPGSGTLSVSSAALAQSYPGLCIAASAPNTNFVQAFTLTGH